MKIEVKRYGEILTSRPAGREAALAILAYRKPAEDERVELDFEGVLAVGPSWLDEVLSALRGQYGRARVVPPEDRGGAGGRAGADDLPPGDCPLLAYAADRRSVPLADLLADLPRRRGPRLGVVREGAALHLALVADPAGAHGHRGVLHHTT